MLSNARIAVLTVLAGLPKDGLAPGAEYTGGKYVSTQVANHLCELLMVSYIMINGKRHYEITDKGHQVLEEYRNAAK